jgi:hypothetical protein
VSAAPWSDEWPSRIASGPVRPVLQLAATEGTFPTATYLQAESVSVTMDEAYVPHVQARASASIPDADTLASLDPRSGVRLRIATGYGAPGIDEDVHELVDAGLRTRSSIRPNGTIDLTAASDEALVDDGIVGSAEDAGFNRTGVNEYVSSVLTAAFSTTQTISTEYPAAYRPDLVSEPMDIYQSPMPRLTELLDPVDGALFCGPDRVWYLRPRRTVASTPVVVLRTGPGGTVIRIDAGVSREPADGWYNEVLIHYQWPETETRPAGEVAGYALVSDGPYAAIGANRRTMTLSRNYYATKANADQAAAAILRRSFTRGRTMRITAPALPWLRPGDTIGYAEGPSGDIDRLLLSAVTFEWPASTMTLTLRRPETGTITIG